MKGTFLIVLMGLIGLSEALARQSDTTRLPLNPTVLHGKLENGFQYYILKTPSKTISMQLIVNAGRLHEEADQSDVSHLIEHIGFRNTVNFPAGLRQFFLDQNIKVQGSTDALFTKYELEIPADKPEMLGYGLLALKDWASGILFQQRQVDEERSAVLRELSMANTPPMFKLKNTTYLLLDKNPLYKYQLLESIENIYSVPVESIERFFNDWYHPVYQAAFIVGEVDVDEVEARLEELFINLSNAGRKQKDILKEGYKTHLTGRNKLIVTESEEGVPGISIRVYKKRETVFTHQTLGSIDKYKLLCSYELITLMMRRRMEFMTRNKKLSDQPKFSIMPGAIHPFAGIDAIFIRQDVMAASDIRQSLTFMAEELERLRLYGFSAVEFAQVKQAYLIASRAKLDRSVNSSNSIERLVDYHLNGSAFPANEPDVILQVAEHIDLKEINNMVQSWLRWEENMDIHLSVPDKKAMDLPSEAEAMFWMDSVRQMKVAREGYEDVIKELPAIPLQRKTISYTLEQLPKIGATKLKFNNGSQVTIKALDTLYGSPGMIKIYGFKMNKLKSKEHHSISVILKDIENFTGFAQLSSSDVKGIKQHLSLDGPYFSVSPKVIPGLTTISGQAAPKHADALLNMINQYLTSGRLDSQACKNYYSALNQKARISGAGAKALEDSVRAIVGSDFHNKQNSDAFTIYDERLFGEASKIYESQFDGGDFTFIITGRFRVDDIINMASQYIGSLPNARHEPYRNYNTVSQNMFQPGKRLKFIGDSINDVHVQMMFDLKLKYQKDKVIVHVLDHVLKSILFTRLREKEKGVYYVNVYHNNAPNQTSSFLNISFQTAPGDLDRLLIAIKDELIILRNGYLKDNIFRNAIKSVRPALIAHVNSADFWTDYLAQQEMSGTYSYDELKQIDLLDSLELSDVINFVRKYLDVNGYMLFELL